MYRTLYLFYRAKESLLTLAESGKIGGAMHTAIGHEANVVDAADPLHPGDYITCTHRGHHHSLARGMNPGRAIAEVWGTANGFAKGKGGSMHFIDLSLGLMGAIGIVGAQVLDVAGMTLATKMRAKNGPSSHLEEGAMFQGMMHETFNMAQKWCLLIIFYCENNRYSEMIPPNLTSSVNNIYMFVQAYGMAILQIDGNDCAGDLVAAFHFMHQPGGCPPHARASLSHAVPFHAPPKDGNHPHHMVP